MGLRRNYQIGLGLKSLFWTALLVAFVRAIWPDPFTEPYVGHWDKFIHGAGCFVLTILAAMAYPRTALPLVGLGILAFGGLIEVLQAMPMIDRDASLGDLLADAVGIGSALIPAMLPGLRAAIRRV
jgi:VanZ family protein